MPDFKLAQSVEEAAKDAITDFVSEDPIDFENIRKAIVKEAGIDIRSNRLRDLLNGMVKEKELEVTPAGRSKKLYSSLPVSRASRE